jgi:putative transposase
MPARPISAATPSTSSRALATEYEVVVVERLHVAGMLRNRRLARAIADSAMAELRRMLTYKSRWYGAELVVADPFYPSSKACSACGWVKAKLSLDERTFVCEICGLAIDRDVNAARNLANLIDHVARSGRETLNAGGAGVRPGLAGLTVSKPEAGAEFPRIGPAPVGAQVLTMARMVAERDHHANG